jgi:23S rRNA (cytidine1920-2'-O)/16S rRNA (cytidine1409-2'-O)-methyltransferase
MKSKLLPVIEILIEQLPEFSEKELFAMLLCGEIKIDGETIRDPRRKVDPLKLIVPERKRWVSRGGIKLEHALDVWKIDPEGKTILDAGSSTGGFTDCLLQKGAIKVHSVDVGYNQLDYKLRIDPRVNVLERTNIMSVSVLEPEPNFAVADLSFRSISGAASVILKLTTENLLIALIKPQFELAETAGFDGVIRDREVLNDVLRATALAVEKEGVRLHAVLESPIKGGKGNVEFLFQLSLAHSTSQFSNTGIIDDFIKGNC